MFPNSNLTKEIVRHIIVSIGNISAPFKIQKTLNFEIEDGSIENIFIYGISLVIEKVNIQVLFSDLGSNEKVLIFKMDENPAYGLFFSDLIAKFMINYENIWINSDLATQAKFLAGFEDLIGLLPKWQQISNYDNMFNLLSSFIGQCE